VAQEHNQLIYGPSISKAAAQAFGGAYSDVGISRLSESLQVVADLWSKPEWAFLRNEFLWWINPSQAAVAAEFAQVGIRNPSGSGMIVVVDRLCALASVSTQYELRIRAQGTIDATATPNARDTRLPQLASGLRTVSMAHTEPAATGPLGFLCASFEQHNEIGVMVPVDFVLSPGFELLVGPSVVNVLANVSFWGRERQAFPGELRG